jgi:hypothetical protein
MQKENVRLYYTTKMIVRRCLVYSLSFFFILIFFLVCRLSKIGYEENSRKKERTEREKNVSTQQVKRNINRRRKER